MRAGSPRQGPRSGTGPARSRPPGNASAVPRRHRAEPRLWPDRSLPAPSRLRRRRARRVRRGRRRQSKSVASGCGGGHRDRDSAVGSHRRRGGQPRRADPGQGESVGSRRAGLLPKRSRNGRARRQRSTALPPHSPRARPLVLRCLLGSGRPGGEKYPAAFFASISTAASSGTN